MCCCGKPTKNGEPNAYSWDGKAFMTRHPTPPPTLDGDEILIDEPGRCGGLDCHCHHFRVVKNGLAYYLLTQRGGGQTYRTELACSARFGGIAALLSLSSDARFWLLVAIYSTLQTETRKATDTERATWAKAAHDKKIKVNRRGRHHRVWIEA